MSRGAADRWPGVETAIREGRAPDAEVIAAHLPEGRV